ncbi:DUF2975 domain-containing protein [Romboutsia weinsteinii]|uniref:DUF2975 domain-containing protein n=1 Tax=Romboutsia weinsteinii TaxID=2020949 RepID=A0A371J0H6_9FIRM|nr:DUF2975 domain-containing protein [Romboutsia weinsteinii]RDY26269.1 DUF2975 domain-containing protein [Romboutsia weinsteinii]
MNTSFLRNTLLAFLYLALASFGVIIIFLPTAFISALTSDFSFLMLVNLFFNTWYIFNYFIVIRKLLAMIKTTNTTPFIFDNVKNFKTMGYCLFINSAFELIIGYKGSQNIGNIQILASNNGAITPTMIICFVSALMCFVIAEIFYKAIKIKEDNDLTI